MLSVKISFTLLFIFYKSDVCLSDEELVPEVETPLGRVSGAWRSSVEGRKFASFEGIPYALPPIRELRFEEPKPITPWIGTLKATHTHMCPQFWGNDTGEEDCLHLNVYVPTDALNHQKKLDVIVAIHAGGFMGGSGHEITNAQFVMERNFIVVTINYRLGILGFLSTEDEVIPGNNGMKDQVQALKWVKDNIASFGGNPDSITITGFSAGGASVHLHYFSPLSKGLFNRGVAHSGTALDPWALRRKPAQRARRLGALLDCPEGSTEDLKKCLKQKPVDLLLEKQNNSFYGFLQMPFSPFAPVVERKSEGAFLIEEPYKQLKNGKVIDVPFVISTCADEGLISAPWFYSELEKLDKTWPDIAHYALDYNETLPISKREEVAKKIKDFYLGPDEPFSEATFKKFINVCRGGFEFMKQKR